LPFLEEFVVVDELSEGAGDVFGALEDQYLTFREESVMTKPGLAFPPSSESWVEAI
jgi:hypothetical protein